MLRLITELDEGKKLFSPKQISGLKFWVKAGVGISGNPVDTWADQSGNGYDFVQATASRRPSPDASLVNGQQPVLFDGVDDTLWNGSIPTFSNKRGTLFCVSKHSNASGGRAAVSLYIHGGNPAPWELGVDSAGTRLYWYDGATTQYALGISPSTWYYHTIIRDGDTSVKIYRNGSLNTSLTVANNQPSAGPIKLGSSSAFPNGSASEQWSGDIAEVIYYDRDLTATELAMIHKYLSRKFGL